MKDTNPMVALYQCQQSYLRAVDEGTSETYRELIADDFQGYAAEYEFEALSMITELEEDVRTEAMKFAFTLRDDLRDALQQVRKEPNERLREVRQRIGMTLEELSMGSEIAVGNLSSYENGRRKITRKAAHRLSNVLGVTSEYLLFSK